MNLPIPGKDEHYVMPHISLRTEKLHPIFHKSLLSTMTPLQGKVAHTSKTLQTENSICEALGCSRVVKARVTGQGALLS